MIILFREARAIMGSLDCATTQARKIHIVEAGKLYRDAFSGFIRLLRSFKDRQPNVDLGLHRMSSARLNEALADRRIDIRFPLSADQW
ncbi:type 2 periplasmic-binding domain-containing protein [Bhargavaea beijingensis]|uniref:hypothetical protein n=1 Tax=Bhargavaea beijingensis TaxID=426756 RepID=UPI00222531B3|nr:hypothetical protein [Bhargavaea beijingensis]MCW1927404.1 hypothetical protein [Bhargavaea beijingensis]